MRLSKSFIDGIRKGTAFVFLVTTTILQLYINLEDAAYNDSSHISTHLNGFLHNGRKIEKTDSPKKQQYVSVDAAIIKKGTMSNDYKDVDSIIHGLINSNIRYYVYENEELSRYAIPKPQGIC